MIRALSFVPLAALLAATACGSPLLEPLTDARGAGTTRPGEPAGDEDEPLQPAPAEVFIAGTITEVPSRLGSASFFIEEDPERPFGPGTDPFTAGDKYYVEVTPQTRIRRRLASGESQPASLGDVRVGMRAEVWFAGPIRESWPMQGTAGRIMLFDP
jgi:hypothetical protein